MSYRVNLQGLRFGKLLVVEYSDLGNSTSKRNWKCLCDCGNPCFKSTSELNSGAGRSCGCVKKKHGMSDTRPYTIWYDMKRRCDREYQKSYESYGGRGITYSDNWKSFENFWLDMGNTYGDNLTLERVDVNGDYCKENCEWVAKEDQSLNKRKYSSNTTGVAGVSLFVKSGREYLRARVQDRSTGKRVSKLVPLSGFSYEEAIELLKEWLQITRGELNYKESHGS